MIFNKHLELEGRHSYLSASKSSWLRYSDEKMADTFIRQLATMRGTRLHALANDLIQLGVKLPDTQATLNRFVNDCIGYGVSPEQPLKYSENAFGTADAVKYHAPVHDGERGTLRIFDLKTGVTPCTFDQLIVYAAYFCLEYGFKPTELIFDLRIYQNDLVLVFEEDPIDDILHAMGKIVHFDEIINELKAEAFGGR